MNFQYSDGPACLLSSCLRPLWIFEPAATCKLLWVASILMRNSRISCEQEKAAWKPEERKKEKKKKKKGARRIVCCHMHVSACLLVGDHSFGGMWRGRVKMLILLKETTEFLFLANCASKSYERSQICLVVLNWLWINDRFIGGNAVFFFNYRFSRCCETKVVWKRVDFMWSLLLVV